MSTIALIAYVAGFVVFVYPVTRLVITSVIREYGARTDIDMVMGGVVGCLVTALWPLVVTGFVAFHVSRRLWQNVLPDEAKEHQA